MFVLDPCGAGHIKLADPEDRLRKQGLGRLEERSIGMCDYSLEMYGSRPAREFERYETTRFPSGSIGLAAPGDCNTAVCIQYDTHLRLENIPAHLQAALHIGAGEDVVFTRLDHGAYRDGVRFANGKEISLQQLNSGVSAVVTQLLETAPAPKLAHLEPI